jgi:hypothetical protein
MKGILVCNPDIVIVHHLILIYFDCYWLAYTPCREETKGKA